MTNAPIKLYVSKSGKKDPTATCGLEYWERVCWLHENPTEFPSKDAQPLCKPARTSRLRKMLGDLTGVVVECDNGALTVTDAAERLRAAGLTGFVHTSASSTPDK